jgi:hypothetical protein
MYDLFVRLLPSMYASANNITHELKQYEGRKLQKKTGGDFSITPSSQEGPKVLGRVLARIKGGIISKSLQG